MKNQILTKKGSCARRLEMPNADKTDFKRRNSSILTNWDSTETSNHDLLSLRMCCDEFVRSSRQTVKQISSPSRNLLSGIFLEENLLRPISMTLVPASDPQTSRSPSSSPNSLAYAGAKFNESPSPKVLPRPPSHWVGAPKLTDCGAIESELKVMLRVQC